MGDFENAKKYLYLAIELMTHRAEVTVSGDPYHNLSLLYSDLKMYDSAFYFNDLAIDIFRRQKLIFHEQTALISKCEYYLNLKQQENAKLLLDSLQKSFDVISEPVRCKYYLLLSELAFNGKHIGASINYANKALTIAISNNNIHDKKNAYDQLYKGYSESLDYKNAFNAHENFILLKDSMFNKEKGLAIQKVIVESIIKEKDSELKIATLEHEHERAKKNKLLWISLSSIIGLASAIVIIYLMLKNQEQKVKISEWEMVLLKRISEEARRKLEMELLKKESEKVKSELELELVKKESEEIKKEIVDFSLHNLKNKEFIELTRNELKAIKRSASGSASVNNLYALTNQFIMNENEKNEFQSRVEDIQKSFFEKLEARFQLTKTEKKLAALLKLNLSSKEIAAILNVSETSIEIYRSSLRKKLQMDSETSFEDYFKNF